MDSLINLQTLFHRSKSRIKDLGEVFTPESYVESMLDLLAKNKRSIWSDECISFFEPCSGHGNIVLAIYKRRLEGMYKKAITLEIKEPALFAIANSLNTLWAIDIDLDNIDNCRTRILAYTLEFLKKNTSLKNLSLLFSKKIDFFAHILSAILWHIHQNETLSSLSIISTAKSNAAKTTTGSKWFSQNEHKPVDFEKTWTAYFEYCKQNGTSPIEFQRAKKFLSVAINSSVRGFDDFSFAKDVFKQFALIEREEKIHRHPVAGL